MPRELSEYAVKLQNHYDEQSYDNVEGYFDVFAAQHRIYALPNDAAIPLMHDDKLDPNETNLEMLTTGVDYLIDATQYTEMEDPKKIPFEEKTFMTLRKNGEDSFVMHRMSAEELLADQRPEGEAYNREIPEPKLTGFSWLRHKLSWLFGEPEAYKTYERQKERQQEVTNAKKAQMIEEKYGYKMVYDKTLADEATAQNYINTGRKEQPQVDNGQPQVSNSQQKTNNEPGKSNDEIKLSTVMRKQHDAKVAADKTMQAVKNIETLFGEKSKKPADPNVVKALKDALTGEFPEQEDKEAQEKLADYILKSTSKPEVLENIIADLTLQEADYITVDNHIEANDILKEVKEASYPYSSFHNAHLISIGQEPKNKQNVLDRRVSFRSRHNSFVLSNADSNNDPNSNDKEFEKNVPDNANLTESQMNFIM